MMVVVEVMAVVVVGVAADHVPSRQMWHMTRLWGGMWGWGRGGVFFGREFWRAGLT